MRPIAITPRNSRVLNTALHAVQGGQANNRVSLMRLFSCADQFETRLRAYRLRRQHRVGAIGTIYGPAKGAAFITSGQTCTRAVIERRSSGWFLTELERLPSVRGCHLRLTLDQAERVLELSEPGRIVLRAFDGLRATVEWQPVTDQSCHEAIDKIADLGSIDPAVYSSLMTIGVKSPEATWAFFRAVAHAAAKKKVAAVLAGARRQQPLRTGMS